MTMRPDFGAGINTKYCLGNSMLLGVADAIQATMLAAHLASPLQLGVKPFASTMQANRYIIRSQAQRGCSRCGRRAIEINALEQISILLRQGRQQPLYALAKNFLRSGISLFRKFRLQSFEHAFSHIAPPIKVNDGSPQDAIKPSDGILARRRFAVGTERFQKAVLNDILGQMWVAHTLPGEGYESVKVF